jgi:hypothetical protein
LLRPRDSRRDAVSPIAVVPVTFSYTFPFTETQEHVFELDTLPGTTTSDSNDFFVVTVQY